MRIEIDFDADKLIDDIMGGQPEASAGMAIQCIDWDYGKCRYIFRDAEYEYGEKHHKEALIKPKWEEVLHLRLGDARTQAVWTLTRPRLRRGLRRMLDALHAGEMPGIAEYVLRDFRDPGNWDSNAADALVQYALFGELIYG
jgi:hypothetical protein